MSGFKDDEYWEITISEERFKKLKDSFANWSIA